MDYFKENGKFVFDFETEQLNIRLIEQQAERFNQRVEANREEFNQYVSRMIKNRLAEMQRELGDYFPSSKKKKRKIG